MVIRLLKKRAVSSGAISEKEAFEKTGLTSAKLGEILRNP